MSNHPSVTGSSILERSKAFIMQMLSLQEKNERIIAEAPQNATASTWERSGEICTIHNAPKFRSLVETEVLKVGEYYCSQCEQERAERRILTLNTGKIHALFPVDGQLARRVRMSEARHNMQEDAAKGFISCLSTQKELKDTSEISMLATLKRKPTNPLPARDIIRADSEPPIETIPTTLLALERSTFFDDEEIAFLGMSNEDQASTTDEHDTQRVPAFSAELLLKQLMRGETSTQETGAQERLPAKSDAWML